MVSLIITTYNKLMRKMIKLIPKFPTTLNHKKCNERMKTETLNNIKPMTHTLIFLHEFPFFSHKPNRTQDQTFTFEKAKKNKSNRTIKMINDNVDQKMVYLEKEREIAPNIEPNLKS